MSESKLTDVLIDFALRTKYEDIPPEVVKMQKRSLIDSIGVMSAATTLETACIPFMDFAEENSVKKNCTIVGTSRKASETMAAMANGSLIHAMDYEDGHDAAKAHSNSAGIPVSLALGESLGKSGSEVLTAMIVSSEICCRLKLALLDNDLENGWYSPPMFSAYGAVFGASRLLGFSNAKTRDALSICMTQVLLIGQSAISGESVLRSVRDAFSAKAAMYGTLLAEKGVVARVDEPFEGELGLYKAIARNRYIPELITDQLGETWESGKLRFKPWPCCGTTHSALDAVLSITRENSINNEEIVEIRLIVNPVHLNVLIPEKVKYRPRSIAAAKFSLPYTVALGLRNGDVRLDMYKEEALQDIELLSLADKVTFSVREIDMTRPKSYYGDDHVEISLITKRGTYTSEVFSSTGSTNKPLNDSELRSKYFDCMRFSENQFSLSECERVYDTVHSFEHVENVRTLFGN